MSKSKTASATTTAASSAKRTYTRQNHTFNAKEKRAIVKSIQTVGLIKTIAAYNSSYSTIRAIADEAGVARSAKKVHEFSGKEKIQIVRSIKAIGVVPTAKAFNSSYATVRDIAEARGIEVLRGRRFLSA